MARVAEGGVEEAAPLAAEAREIFERLRAAPCLERRGPAAARRYGAGELSQLDHACS